MFDQLYIDLAPLIDSYTALETEAKTLTEDAADLATAKQKMFTLLSGEAAQAAADRMDDVANKMLARAGKLTRNAGVVKNLVKLYDEADLAGSRAFGP